MPNLFRAYALPAAVLLGGALPAGFGLSFLISGWLPSHSRFAIPVQFVVAVGVMLLFGGLWGRSVARSAGSPRPARLAWTAAIAFVVATLAAVFGLGLLERLFVEERALGYIPVHIIFAPLFTLSAFFLAAVMALVVGAQLRGWPFGLHLAWRAGLAAAATFLIADIVQDLLGRRVGGPNAAATLTMLSVAFIGNFLAALVAGLVMGRLLSQSPALHVARAQVTTARDSVGSSL